MKFNSAPKSLLLEEKVAEAERSSAKTDEVDTCTNSARNLNPIEKEQVKPYLNGICMDIADYSKMLASLRIFRTTSSVSIAALC